MDMWKKSEILKNKKFRILLPEDQCAREWEMLFKTYLPSEKRIATVE